MKKSPLGSKNEITTLSERVYRAGYVVKKQRVEMVKCPTIILDSAFTPNGQYIGDTKTARYLIVKRGIQPQLRTPTSNTCSIGYCAREKKWYGWSHRAIFGYKVGQTIKQFGDELLPVGFKIKNIEEAKKAAEAFAESVS